MLNFNSGDLLQDKSWIRINKNREGFQNQSCNKQYFGKINLLFFHDKRYLDFNPPNTTGARYVRIAGPDCCWRSSLHWEWPEPSPLLLIIISCNSNWSFTNCFQFTNISLSVPNAKPIYHWNYFEWVEIFSLIWNIFKLMSFVPQFPDKTLNRVTSLLWSFLHHGPAPHQPQPVIRIHSRGNNEGIQTWDCPHCPAPCPVICLTRLFLKTNIFMFPSSYLSLSY